MWLLFDIMSVSFHIASILTLSFIPLSLTAFSEVQYSSYSVADYNQIITAYDLSLTPWKLTEKTRFFRKWNLALVLLSALFLVLQLVELFTYYGLLQFPINTLRYFNSKLTQKASCVLRNLHEVHCLVLGVPH